MSSIRDKVGKNLQQQTVGGFGNLNIPQGYKLFKPKVNTRVNMDILMYEVSDEKHPDRDDDLEIAVPGTLWYRRPYKVHKGIGASNETVTCPTTFGEPCPVCEYVKQEFKKNPGEEEKELLRSIRAKDWVLYAFIPIDHDEYEEEVHILNISFFNFQAQLKEELEENEEFWAFPDLEGGYTLNVRFTGASVGGGRKFPKVNRIDFEERDEDYTEEILDEVPNLDELLVVKSYQEIQTIFSGIPADTEEYEDVPQDKPARSTRPGRKRKTTSRKTKSEPEANEQSEEEAPKKTRTAKTTKTTKEKGASKSTGSATKRGSRGKSTKTTKNNEEKEDGGEGKEGEEGEAEYECPHGMVFGRDFETADVCGDCELWNLCSDKYEEYYKKS